MNIIEKQIEEQREAKKVRDAYYELHNNDYRVHDFTNNSNDAVSSEITKELSSKGIKEFDKNVDKQVSYIKGTEDFVLVVLFF